MKGKKWLVLPASLAFVLLASGIGVTRSSFVNLESSIGNNFQAWASTQWVQTEKSDFEAGVFNEDEIDISSSEGDVLLSLVSNPTLVTSDNNEVSTSSVEWQLLKTLNFTKDGDSYDELRIDSNLKIEDGGGATAFSSIHVDDVEEFSYSTNSTSYVSYSDVIDFSGYIDGEYTVKLYLMTSSSMKSAYNSTLELYRTKTYASSGTIASKVRDTTAAGATWNALFWDETLESNTDITFEARASDNLFDKSDGTPSWTDLGAADSPITSGLPSGQYMQWRATLTISDNSKTPTLEEIRVYHY